MSAAAKLLERLDRVKQTGSSRWIARCPAHPDRSPSLSIREIDAGVLLHDFGGCDVNDVLGAIGLELKDLFDKPIDNYVEPSHYSAIPARDLLVLLDHEITVAVIILDEVIRLRTIRESQLQRLMEASARIGQARDIAAPAKVSHAA